jgi:hypothetical protein
MQETTRSGSGRKKSGGGRVPNGPSGQLRGRRTSQAERGDQHVAWCSIAG